MTALVSGTTGVGVGAGGGGGVTTAGSWTLSQPSTVSTASATTVSEPSPQAIVSASPSRALTVSFPAPASRTSRPAPPSSVSFPIPPNTTSGSPPVVRTSFPENPRTSCDAATPDPFQVSSMRRNSPISTCSIPLMGTVCVIPAALTVRSLGPMVKDTSPTEATLDAWSKSASHVSYPSPPSIPLLAVNWMNRSSPGPPEANLYACSKRSSPAPPTAVATPWKESSPSPPEAESPTPSLPVNASLKTEPIPVSSSESSPSLTSMLTRVGKAALVRVDRSTVSAPPSP